ncbi:LysR family transcriptional regulator [Cupriavidus taiwanensis]|uniref:Transcriptional regulator, LysR n=1 Tax=Cupriavidus taiwanensis (strain DSM 17343 / BCRC 17206 / CCUG 44338 / CIP 107171 / LMG 19424 / R1) TaxID=977880 RepID=B3RBN2_CUPTR|nr:LysR family transcriptional regulator [Cupriavidus taiwanensis]CAQ72307.1 putative transcriptional regulator, LysR [Cupriavidus taiwanensis LMG 19424]
MLKLEGIASFVTVVEAGSISEAARRLNLSKSVVSDRLVELERGLGATLLRRTTRKLLLTDEGNAFLDRATRIMREVEEASTDVAERRGRLAGPLRISAPVTFGRMHLGPALYPFLAKHPELELTLDLDDRRVDAAADGYDAVVRHGPLEDSRLVAWQLAPSRRLLVASPAYLDHRGTPASPEQLRHHRGIFYLNRGAADWRLQGKDGTEIVRAPIALRVNNGDMMRDAAEAGLGIALLPTFIAGPSIRRGTLAVVDIGLQAIPESIYIAHPDGRRAPARLRAFAECVRAAIGSPPYWDANGASAPKTRPGEQ